MIMMDNTINTIKEPEVSEKLFKKKFVMSETTKSFFVILQWIDKSIFSKFRVFQQKIWTNWEVGIF